MSSEDGAVRSLAGVVVPVFIGAMLLLGALALQIGARIQDERVERSVHYARALAAVTSEALEDSGASRDRIPAAGAALMQAVPEVSAYAVVKEEGGAAGGDGGGLGDLLGGGGGGGALESLFANLAGKEILAHSDASLVGRNLSTEDGAEGGLLSQAQLFREANALRDRISKNVDARGQDPSLSKNPYMEVFFESLDDDSVLVMVPVKDGERLVATATVLAKPHRVEPSGVVIWIIGSALATLALGYVLARAGAPGIPALGLLFMVPILVLSSQAYDDTTTRITEAHTQAASVARAMWLAGGGEGSRALVGALNQGPYGEITQLYQAEPEITARPEAVSSGGAARWWPSAAAGFTLLALVALFWTGRAQRAYDTFVKHWFAYAYIAPTMVGMLILVFGPFTYGLGLAFFARIYGDFHFVGLRNFVEILGSISVSSGFYTTFGVTVLWTVVNVVLHVSIGLALALLLKDKSLGGTAAYRALLIVPWAVPNYITALIWKGLFNKEFGAINAFLGVFGVEPVSWFDTFWKAFFANVATNTWLGFPFMMVVSLGALQSIPQDLYEAADVDGAGRWAKFRFITLPLLKPALFPAVILGIIWTFNMFNVIYLVSGGAPDGQTDILITEAYRWAFERGRYGYAAAYSTIIFVILLAYTLITNRLTRATEGAYE